MIHVLTFAHLEAADTKGEVGVEYAITDADGNKNTGRALITLSSTTERDAFLEVVKADLTAKLGELPVDIDPGIVTTALMQERAARQRREKAEIAAREAEERAAKAATREEEAAAAIAAKQAELDALQAKIAAAAAG